MTEPFLQFLWKRRLFWSSMKIQRTGELVKIINCGEQNPDAGPDFFNARIEINGVLWAGNVEIHLKASDWLIHKHDRDPAYNNVILHVCLEDDREIFTSAGRIIPALEINIDPGRLSQYSGLMESEEWLACRDSINKVEPFRIKYWLGSILVERIIEKTKAFEKILGANRNDWEESFYQGLARAFGFKINADQFESLARSLPLRYLFHHRDRLFQLEALLFGQAGFLTDNTDGDEYFLSLSKEYNFLRKKYSLKAMEVHQWKFMRIRPSNFPTLRIAQFAALISHAGSLFSSFIGAAGIKDMLELFNFRLSDYWRDHYRFNKISTVREKALGREASFSLLINTLIPFMYLYGKSTGDEELAERAVNLLDEIPPEKNSIIRSWDEAGIHADSALYSQALIQLKNKYCNFKRCLECEIGNQLLAANK